MCKRRNGESMVTLKMLYNQLHNIVYGADSASKQNKIAFHQLLNGILLHNTLVDYMLSLSSPIFLQNAISLYTPIPESRQHVGKNQH